MMAEIQTKYKDKPEKQQEELMKLQQQGYKPTAGCVPMLLNFLVMFGVIGVVYNPLERIFHISAAALTAAGEALTASGVAFTAITRDTNIIAQVIAGNSGVLLLLQRRADRYHYRVQPAHELLWHRPDPHAPSWAFLWTSCCRCCRSSPCSCPPTSA